MRHPRLFLSLSLLVPALVGCGDTTYATASATGTTTDASTTDASSTTGTSDPTTGAEPVIPEIPTNRYFLRIDDSPPPPVVAEMDRAKTIEIFGEEFTKEIKLIDVDPDPLLTEVLARIHGSCGDKWKEFNPDPQPDCTLTELGQTYGPDWRYSPQYRMVALMTMTPINANVRGTSLSDFEQLILQNPVVLNGLNFTQILAASLFCDGDPAQQKACAENPPPELLTRAFLERPVLQDTLKETLVLSHPNINPDGTMPVTLHDALLDMQPLSTKFGPVGDHPGLLVPDDDTFTTYSDALTSDFKMIATAQSNLRRVDGIDASVGAGEMFISLGATPLAFDFEDPEKVQFEGLTAVPTVDMRMRITELPTVIPSCEDTGDCKLNAPDSPTGDAHVWSQKPWTFEYIVAKAARQAFLSRTFEHCYLKLNNTCYMNVSIGSGGNPTGWTVFSVGLDPKPKLPGAQYLWELLLDIAQTSVHDFECVDTPDYDQDGDTTELLACAGPNDADPDNDPDLEIEEGDMAPMFVLKKVPLGLTADDLLAQLRPTMQKQAAKIADALAGAYWKNNARLDFYYRRGDDGVPYLYFVGPSDKRPAAGDPNQLSAYMYEKPGFFTDPGLTDKVSSKTLPGVSDTEHEKFGLPTGATTLYMQDEDSVVYRLDFTVHDPAEVVVRVTPL